MSERLLVLGDVHGAYRALQQVIDRCNYDPTEDRIIFLGDVCDGWSETYECIEYLIELDEVGGVTSILGNHDEWFRDWASGKDKVAEPMWYHQGGKATIESYGHEIDHLYETVHLPWPRIPDSHLDFLEGMTAWTTIDNMAFTHGGFTEGRHFSHGDHNWNRSYWAAAKIPGFQPHPVRRVFIGHTSIGDGTPEKRHNIWNLDTGAGWEGRLTIMDAHTEEYWQSDLCSDLYPDEKGRRS